MKKVLLSLGLVLMAVSAQAENRSWYVNPTGMLNVIIGQQYKPNGNPSVNQNAEMVTAEVGKNWGMFEAGPILGYTHFKGGNVSAQGTSSEVYGSSWGVFGRYNFIENKNGEWMVPFIRASFVNAQQATETIGGTSNGAKDSFHSDRWAGRIGVDFFPINDNIALQAAAEYGELKYYSSNDKVTGANVIGTFSLYF